jgi:dihydroorotase
MKLLLKNICKITYAVHCEDEATIKSNLEKYKAEFGEDIPVTAHHLIRSEAFIFLLQRRSLLPKKQARVCMFSSVYQGNEFVYEQNPLGKKITAEVCIHHLWFTNGLCN